MATAQLITDARKAWVAYSNALARHFGLPKDSQLAADGFEQFVQHGAEASIMEIVSYLKSETDRLLLASAERESYES